MVLPSPLIHKLNSMPPLPQPKGLPNSDASSESTRLENDRNDDDEAEDDGDDKDDDDDEELREESSSN